jgi:hypothetical protein
VASGFVLEPRKHTGTDERRLAASGAAMDDNEATLGEVIQQVINHPFAPKED